MIITIGGLAGSGTTTVARILSERLGISYISQGAIFRELAKNRGVTLEEFGRIAEQDDTIDRMIDSRQKELAKKHKDLILEGRLSGIFLEDADLRVWLKAPLDLRALRVSERDGIGEGEACDLIKERERSEWRRYKSYYGVDLEDLSVYDIVIDTSRWSAEEVCEIIIRALELLQPH